jgi:hypothetical protein
MDLVVGGGGGPGVGENKEDQGRHRGINNVGYKGLSLGLLASSCSVGAHAGWLLSAHPHYCLPDACDPLPLRTRLHSFAAFES